MMQTFTKLALVAIVAGFAFVSTAHAEVKRIVVVHHHHHYVAMHHHVMVVHH